MSEETPLIRYPVDYEYKVIGRAGDGFVARVRELVGGALGLEILDEQVEVLSSSAGKFESVRVRVALTCEAQRAAVYEALHTESRIVFYL